LEACGKDSPTCPPQEVSLSFVDMQVNKYNDEN